MRTLLFVLLSPILIIDHYLSFLQSYRRLWGGHWERWELRHPCSGRIWVRMKQEDCFRMTGKKPGGLQCGTPRCEPVPDIAVYCECGRDLIRAPGVYGAYRDGVERGSVYDYSCPCGRWPSFLFGPPAPIYLGDARDKGKA
jgi:hypothetical protein